MANVSIDQLKQWFAKGFYPTAAQFAAWLDSYWHKDEQVPMAGINGLSDAINSKYPAGQGAALEGRMAEAEDNTLILEEALDALDTQVQLHDSEMIREAPEDGKVYGRQDAEWVEIASAPPAATSAHIIFNKTIADPANIVGDINTGVIAEILAKMRRCLCKYTGSGQMTIRYLSNENSNYYDDGTPALLDGTEGDVMVFMPEFYYKFENLDEGSRKLSFSHTQPDGTWGKITGGLIGAFMNYHTDRMVSCYADGDLPAANITSGVFELHATARGTGYILADWEMYNTIAFLFMAKYGTRNSLTALGSARGGTTTPMGTSVAIGNNDTSAATTSGWVSFRGIEGVLSNIAEMVYGSTYRSYSPDGETLRRELSLKDADGSVRTVYLPAPASTLSYISEVSCMNNGDRLELVPTALAGTQTTYFCAPYRANPNGTTSYYTLTRGLGSIAALYPFYVLQTEGKIDVGARLAFRGTITEAASVADFKAITITN